MDANIKFKTMEIANQIKKNETEILKLYTMNGYSDEAKSLKEELNNVSKEEQIRVVFIGQYTAGKSTIIAALTSDRTIMIDSDIATSETSDYSWNGVTLTDTPGLYTGNKEHDDRTIEMIKKSDLLVYCITSDLFNQYTLNDFEKWAFESGFANKMFLVVNKMSKEAGEYNELVHNYADTINRSLLPHTVGEFSHSFVDAKDYKDGIADEDRELVEYSHFEDFISKLNDFIQRKGLLGKLDTPIMIMKASIDDVRQKMVVDEGERAYNALLSRIEKKIDQQRNQVYIEAHSIIQCGLRPIKDKGYELSRVIGVEEINYTEDDINELISTSCKKINAQLASLCEKSLEDLNLEIEDVMNSNVASYFFNSVSSSYDGKIHLFESKETKYSRAQFESLRTIVENITGKTIGLATRESTASAKYFIKSTEATGSQLHKAILAVGNKIGYKFKPWQAANIAKNIGNMAKVMGPVIDAVSIFVDIKETVDDQRRFKEVQSAQLECRKMFLDIVSDLEKKYDEELNGIFQVYEDVSYQINESRTNVQKIIQSNDEMSRKLISIRDDLTSIQSEIF